MATNKSSAPVADTGTLELERDALLQQVASLQAQVKAQSPGELEELRERLARFEASRVASVSVEDVRATVGADADAATASTKARWRIFIARTGAPNEASEVKVSVNGRMYQIQKGVAADVPPEVVLVLNDSIATTPLLSADGQVTGWADSSRIPFQIMGLAVDADGNKLL